MCGPAYLAVLKPKCAIDNQASLPPARIIPAADNLLLAEHGPEHVVPGLMETFQQPIFIDEERSRSYVVYGRVHSDQLSMLIEMATFGMGPMQLHQVSDLPVQQIP